MGQICKLPSTPELNTDNNANHIKQMTQQDEVQQEEEDNKISEQYQSFLPVNQISMQLSCTPEFGLPPQQTKLFSQQDSQYTPEFLALSQPLQQQMNIYQQSSQTLQNIILCQEHQDIIIEDMMIYIY